MNLMELKIIGMYLSKIDSEEVCRIEEDYEKKQSMAKTHEEKNRILKEKNFALELYATIIFTKKEFCSLLGIGTKNLKNKQMLSYIKNLESAYCLVKTDNGYKKVNLFSSSSYNVDNQEITLACNVCNDEIKRFLFDSNNYLHNESNLKTMLRLKSKYSFHMYNYLLNNIHYKKGWEVSVDKLREKLDCQNGCYMDFQKFNAKILKKIQAEINSKTNIRFQYKTIKNYKNKVIKIHISCQMKDVENVITPEYEETKILTKDEVFQSYSGCLGGFIMEFKRPLNDKEIENIGVWCQRYSEDEVLRSLYLVKRFIKHEENIFSCIEEILKICYNANIKIESFFSV
nr:replication initiation protein [uncultured Dubosiella sp.]